MRTTLSYDPATVAHDELSKPDVKVVALQHPIRNTLVALFVLVTAWMGLSVVLNENMRWDVVGRYLFATPILKGAQVTIILTIASMVIGILIGLLVAAARMSHSRVLSALSATYVGFIRSVPLLVQLIFWFNIAIIFPKIRIGIPFTDIGLEQDSNVLITSIVASIIGLSLHESALMAEIIRGGIMSVPRGQREAAQTLGFSDRKILLKIIIPQALRAIIPPTGNQLINMMKATAMVAFIAGGDLLTAAQNIYTRNMFVIPLLIVITIWYLALTIIASIGQAALEKKYGKGFARL